MKLLIYFLFSLLAALPVAVTSDNGADSSELSDTEQPPRHAQDDAMREIKAMQDQADFEASQEIIREIEDAELAKKLDEQEAGLGSDHSDPLGDRDVAPAEENTPPPGPGLRYRKAPVDDDILSSRRKTRTPPVKPTPPVDTAGSSPGTTTTPTEGTSSSAASAPAGEARKKVMMSEEDRVRRVRMEFSRQWQKDHTSAVPTPEESPPNSKHTPEGDQSAFMENTESYINSARKGESTEDKSMAYYALRYRIPRQWGRPVEAILQHNIQDSMGRRSTSTLYDVLGVSSSTSIGDIKKTFRQKSLKVHPDKNPHPDAKLAFDLLSDAHDVLSDEETRQIYDERLELAKSVHSPFKWPNIRRKISCFLDNVTSRLLLFFARIRRGQWKEEVEDFVETIKMMPIWNLKRGSVLLYKRFALLPTWQDRVILFGEIVWTWKVAIALTSMMAFSLPKLFFPSMTKIDNYYYDAM